ncbi:MULTISPECIES: hypothetical protein [unclassified Microbacterium]|uniref:hypothetical protein n=1 Tax=unclassified Microbacterium TaxID=2609290 RepID=UPI00041F8EA4|nr:hypothetical protein [Microbacterium sp. B24]
MLTTAIARVFTAPTRPLEPLPLEVERELIAAAKLSDERAYEALIDQYAPAIRKATQREHRRLRDSGVDIDEVRSLVLLGFVEAVATCEGERLAGNIRPAIARTIDAELPSPSAVTVPARTMSRFMAVLAEAGGDIQLAAELAPSMDLSVETFHSVREALRSWDSLEGLTEDGEEGHGHGRDLDAASAILTERGYASVEAKAMCAAAFAAIAHDEKATLVVRDAYGFSDYRPLSDAEVAERRGMSRSAVQRTRTEALGTMRRELGVEVSA